MKQRTNIRQTMSHISCGILASCLVWALAACSSDPAAPADTTNFSSVINAGGDFPAVTESETVDGPFEEIDVRQDGSTWVCERTTYSVTQAPDDFPNFNPGAEVIYPGNLLQGESLRQATPDIIPVRRGPGTVTMTILNGGTQNTEEVAEVSLSSIIQAQNTILSGTSPDIPANFVLRFEQVHSREQLALTLKASISGWFSDIDAGLSFSSDRSYNRLLVALNQSYFTMAVNPFTSYGDVFHPTVTPEQLAQYIQPGNPATYISSVTYGRVMYYLMESTSSYEEMEASISGSFSAALSGGDIETSTYFKRSLSNVNVKAYVLGGDTGSALGAANGDFSSLQEFLTEGGTITTGVPLSYTVRALADARPVKVGLATQYDIVDCRPVSISPDAELAWFKADGQLTVDADGIVTRWEDAFTTNNDAVPGFGGTAQPTLVADAVNGLPAVQFEPEGLSLTYDGGDFNNSNYTIFAVIRSEPAVGQAAFFLFGGDLNTASALTIGYVGNETFRLSHFGGPAYDFDVQMFNSGGFELVSLRYDIGGDAEIWKNGRPRGTPAPVLPLTSNLQAQIGLRRINSPVTAPAIQIAELVMYHEAIGDDQREAMEEILMRKYALGVYEQ